MRVLFLTHRLPYAPDRGDRIRAYHMLRVLSRSTEIDLVSLVHDEEEARGADTLRRIVNSVTLAPIPALKNYPAAALTMLTSRPLTHALLDSPALGNVLSRIVRERNPDIVLAYCSGMARFALNPPLASVPFVLDMVDVDSRKWASLGALTKSPKKWIYRREARCLAQFEVAATRRALVTLVVNDRERDVLATLVPGADIRVVQNGIDLQFFQASGPPADAPGVVFCGVMNYEPNVTGGLWLIREVWPAVRAAVPNAELTLVGSDPRPDLLTAAAADPSVTVTGRVPDVRPYLWRAAVAVAPLFTARGVQNKVIEATAAGLPSVVSSAVFDGLPAEVRAACRVADDAAPFAAAIVELLRTTPATRRALVARADLTDVTWDRTLAPLLPILKSAGRTP